MPVVLFSLLHGGVPGAAASPDRIPVPTPRPATVDTIRIPIPQPRPSAVEMARIRVEQSTATELPKEERHCRRRLEKLGVGFRPAERIVGSGGCGIAHPLEIRRLPGGIELSGKTFLNCQAAEQFALWTSGAAAPAAKRIYGKELVRIDQFASYVCRTRNSQNGAKLSEHAKGSAIDLGRFTLSDGTVIEVGFAGEKENRRKQFLKALRDSGCTYFTTVLGPGSDAHHKNHFHFDMAQRRRGYRYCR